MVPDFKLGATLMELKCYGVSNIFVDAATLMTRCGSTKKRASQVHPDYLKKCKEKDIIVNKVPAGTKGPMQTKLESYGKIKALVVGPWGEASTDLHEFIEKIIEMTTFKKWKSMGADNPKDAKAVISNYVYKALGVTFVRAQAKLKRHAIEIMFGQASETSATARRHKAMGAWRLGRSEYAASYGRGFYMYPEEQ